MQPISSRLLRARPNRPRWRRPLAPSPVCTVATSFLLLQKYDPNGRWRVDIGRMSRRRKYGDSPSLKNTPRPTVAAEDGSWVAEPRRRRLRSSRGSGLSPAGAAPPGCAVAAAAAAARCGPGQAEERYETPGRVLKVDILPCTFNSPTDPDGQNDIFWDQNSPLTKQLGKGRRKQIYITDTDEISHIVNRIAPQDEKPITDSMLGMWIGETAIPCTPCVAKEKSRGKISCTKLRTKNREKELMKLAKQFDKNMEELDVIQEQSKKNHDFIQPASEMETLYKREDHMKSLCGTIPKADNAIIKKAVNENIRIPVENDQNSSQKPFDQNAEAALNAIFDGSTQKCSGQLSQDMSEALVNNNITCGKQCASREEKITNEMLVKEKLLNKIPVSLISKVDVPKMTKSYVTPSSEDPKVSNKYTGVYTASDFEDDWESLLGNEPCVMQNVEMLELFPSKTAQVTDSKGTCTFISKNDKTMARRNINLDARLKDSKLLQNLPSKTHNRELIESGKNRFLLNPNNQDKIQDCAVASTLSQVKEHGATNYSSNGHASEKKSALNTRYPSEQKNIFNHSFKEPIDSFGSAALNNETNISHPNQTNTSSKLSSFFDDWNDPSLTNELIKACHQLETTWEADDVDDDLLYQACDDIERLSQQQEIIKDNKMSESIKINNSSRHGARNMSVTSKPGNHLVPSKHLGSMSVQTSSVNNLQINKSMKMEKREICVNSPYLLNATNLTRCSENLKNNYEINNLCGSWSNTGIPIQVDNSKSGHTNSSTWNVSSDHTGTEISTNKKWNTKQLSHWTITDEAYNGINKPARSSKFTFTKKKNSQIPSQFNQNCIAQSMSATKTTQSLEKRKTVNSLLGEPDWQQTLELSGTLKHSPKEEEEKNRKYSPEEIQRKRQEALGRRMAKSQASSVN
ncbi:ewing's tumor-associated antigen 1 isoform X1 [Dipodomys merriami]|uniref:ewing's tumor-associated antigen 1 isoform X1 n=2 Tax=Dipodomys merriami TaxID=94247 RepID=UPI0038556B02